MSTTKFQMRIDKTSKNETTNHFNKKRIELLNEFS